MKYKAILFDFDGVLSHDRFYKPLKDSHPQVWEFIQTGVFSKNNSKMVLDWMKGGLSCEHVSEYISRNTLVDTSIIHEALIKGAQSFEVDHRILKLVGTLRSRCYKTCLVTDNMDVFDSYICPDNKLERLFDVVVSSSAYHTLKSEKLFEIALSKINHSFSNSTLIEDSKNAVEYFRSKGGCAHLYTCYEEFMSWAKINIL